MFKILEKLLNAILFTLSKIIALRSSYTNHLLIVRLDNIGDYVLFRNCLQTIRESIKYKGFKITLLGSIKWKDLAETLDSGYVDNFIWLDTERYYRKNMDSFIYTVMIQINLLKNKYHSILYPVYSRVQRYDNLIKNISSLNKICCSGDFANKKKIEDITAKVYSEIIQTKEEIGIFEFDRNKEIISKLLEQEITLNRPVIALSDLPHINQPLPEKYIVLHIETSSQNKQWNIEFYEEVARYILAKQICIVLLGYDNEKKLLNNNRLVIDLRGKTTLPEAAGILGSAYCFIGNDSSLLHIAAAVGIKNLIAVCFGQFYGRFVPYPQRPDCNYHFIFPPKIMENIHNPDYLKKKYAQGEYENINLIKPEDVIAYIPTAK